MDPPSYHISIPKIFYNSEGLDRFPITNVGA